MSHIVRYPEFLHYLGRFGAGQASAAVTAAIEFGQSVYKAPCALATAMAEPNTGPPSDPVEFFKDLEAFHQERGYDARSAALTSKLTSYYTAHLSKPTRKSTADLLTFTSSSTSYNRKAATTQSALRNLCGARLAKSSIWAKQMPQHTLSP